MCAHWDGREMCDLWSWECRVTHSGPRSPCLEDIVLSDRLVYVSCARFAAQSLHHGARLNAMLRERCRHAINVSCHRSCSGVLMSCLQSTAARAAEHGWPRGARDFDVSDDLRSGSRLGQGGRPHPRAQRATTSAPVVAMRASSPHVYTCPVPPRTSLSTVTYTVQYMV